MSIAKDCCSPKDIFEYVVYLFSKKLALYKIYYFKFGIFPYFRLGIFLYNLEISLAKT